mgnify:CR=1 FL=1
MITSLILMLVCGIFALALEFSCEEVYIKHKDFIVNLMLGIFASSLVTLVVSYLSYKEIWSESLADYILIADELFYKNAFFHRYLIGIMKKGNISLEECVSDELLDTFYDRLQYTIFLKDGSIIYISLNNNGIKIFDILISVDINGRKGPNVVGKDVFCYNLSTQNSPYSGLVSKTNFWGLIGTSTERETLLNDSQRGCNKNASGQYCGALIQYDNWEISDDYPW